jgi:hypothetical protein
MFNEKYSYWGGSCYRTDARLRKNLREAISEQDIRMCIQYNMAQDEGIMCAAATKLGIKGRFFPDARWQWPNFWEGVEDKSEFIHIRKKKLLPNGKVQTQVPKIENYYDMLNRGIILP